MRIVRLLGIALLILLVAASIFVAVARQSDGPIAIVAGGPLVAGELVSGPEPDWRFVRDVETIELQLLSPPRSRTTWIVEHEGRVFVPCGFMSSTFGRLWKKWPIEAEQDGRAVVRIRGKRYERRLQRVRDPALFEPVAARVAEKYATPTRGTDLEESGLWIFELAPPDA